MVFRLHSVSTRGTMRLHHVKMPARGKFDDLHYQKNRMSRTPTNIYALPYPVARRQSARWARLATPQHPVIRTTLSSAGNHLTTPRIPVPCLVPLEKALNALRT